MSDPIAAMMLQPLLSSTRPETITVVQVLPHVLRPCFSLHSLLWGVGNFGFWWGLALDLCRVLLDLETMISGSGWNSPRESSPEIKG